MRTQGIKISVAAILAVTALAPGAMAQDNYPSRDIEIITPGLEKIQFTNSGGALLRRPDKLHAHRVGAEQVRRRVRLALAVGDLVAGDRRHADHRGRVLPHHLRGGGGRRGLRRDVDPGGLAAHGERWRVVGELLDARAYLTFTELTLDGLCGGGGCSIEFTGGGELQVELLAGLAFEF